MNKFHHFLLCCLCWIPAFAQFDLRVGQWRSHMSHATGNFVAQNSQYVFFGTNGGLVSIDKTSEEVKFITKVEGLNDIKVQTLAWDEKSKKLIVAYSNSNIDLYDPSSGKVINLPDIQRNARILGDRIIYRIHIPSGSDFAYLACGFGMVELNLQKQEFGFTVFTGIPVNEMALYKNKLYGATESGVYSISYDKQRFNLNDFGQWTFETAIGTKAFQSIQVYNDLLYLGSNQQVLTWNGSSVDLKYTEAGTHSMQYLSAQTKQLLVGYSCKNDCDGKLYSINTAGQISLLSTSCVPRPLYAITDEKNRGWFADRFQAFRSTNNINEPCSFKYFNTPLSPYSTDILIDKGKVFVAAGGIDESETYLTRGDGFFSLTSGIWRFFNRSNNTVMAQADLLDLFKMALDPVTGLLYIGTYWGGLMQCDVKDPAKPVVKVFDKNNSSLQGGVGDLARTRVGGLTFDRQGNLWMCNYLAEKPISVMKRDGSWKNFTPPTNTNVLYCGIDSSDILWFVVSRFGLLAYKPGNIDLTQDDQWKFFNSGNSVMTSNTINALATDLDGSVWIGTTDGVFVFECGESVFDAACKGSKRVVVQQDLGSGLLSGEDVQSIAIDGANRKWFGTRKGLFVISAGGDQLIARYTIDNSPLFDNLVTALRYDGTTGEMFIGTGSGLQSIRTDASIGSKTNSFSDIYAFPNPVRPEYTGPVTIQGMRRNSYVKITDFNGHLVQEGRSTGGTYTWDAKDANGRRVTSGMYVAWISAGDGFEAPDTKKIKIAVVR